MFPENKISSWYKSLPYNNKLAFFSTILVGFICHGFMMANKWLNLDDIVQLVDTMNRTTSGRWFLMFPSAIGSEFSLPWLNGFLTIIYSSVMASIIVSMFDIKSKINSILIGGILVTFPTIGSLMPFMNTQDSYQFGAMLTGIGAYLLVKKEKGYLYSMVLFTLSLAIYQAYLGYAAGLILVYFLIELFKKEKTTREIFNNFLKMMISFTGAILIYLLVSRGIFGKYLVDYKGLDTMGSIPLKELPKAVFSTYKNMFLFFTGYEFNYHWSFMPYIFVISFILLIYLIFYIGKKSRLDKDRMIFTAFILILLPPAINVIYIMSWQAGVMLRMAYAYTVCFMMPLILIDYIYKINATENHEMPVAESNENFASKKLNLLHVSVWFLVVVSFLSVYNNIYVTNKAYFKVWNTNKSSHAYANRISMRIEMVDGYTTDTKVVMLGNPDSRTDFTKLIDTRDTEPFIIANHLTRLYSFKYYPERFLGLDNPISDVDEITDKLEPLRATIEEMPLYPAKDSIQMIDGTIYIKFKDIKWKKL